MCICDPVLKRKGINNHLIRIMAKSILPLGWGDIQSHLLPRTMLLQLRSVLKSTSCIATKGHMEA